MNWQVGQVANLPLLVILLLLAGGLRIHGLTWGGGYLLDGDEFRVVYNGLSVYYTGQQSATLDSDMTTYPPYRAWEVALSRAILTVAEGQAPALVGQLLLGRWLTVGYGLVSTALVYRIGRHLIPQWPMAGMLAALLLAVWPGPMLREGRLILADAPALCFSLACLYAGLSVRTSSNPSRKANRLIVAWGLGLLAALAKYNTAPILFLPLLLTLQALWQAPRQTASSVLLPSALLALPLLTAWVSMSQLANLPYDYLQPNENAQHVEQQMTHGQVLDQNSQDQYASHQAGFGGRVQMNFELLGRYLPWPLLALSLLGTLWRPSREVAIITALGLLTFLGISLFRALGERQLLLVMVIVMLLAVRVYGLFALTLWDTPIRFALLALPVLGLLYWGQAAWKDGQTLRQTDSRVALVEWLSHYASDGSRLATEGYLYELNRLNGFRSPKTLFQTQVVSLYRPSTAWWACLRPAYAIAQDDFARREGYYSRQSIPAALTFLREFAPPHYSGPRLSLFAAQSGPPTCERAIYNAAWEARLSAAPITP
jgi:hypothetical protein